MQPEGFHIAELNYGRLVAEADDPAVAEFISAIDRVNEIAERSPGFVWRLPEEEGSLDANGVDPADARLSVNMSVWETAGNLEAFVFNTVHRVFYERGALWFERPMAQEFVMWWVPAGHRPTVFEAMDRLAHRKANGDSDHAFGWSWLKEAQLWSAHRCQRTAAE
jgi:hypothetical protein